MYIIFSKYQCLVITGKHCFFSPWKFPIIQKSQQAQTSAEVI